MISVQSNKVGDKRDYVKRHLSIISIQTGVQSHHYNSHNIGSSHANVAAANSSTHSQLLFLYIFQFSIVTNITTCVVVDIP